MKNKIFELENTENLIITPEYIAITKKKTSDFDELLKWSEMISMKDDFTKIHRKNLIEIKFNELDNYLKIKYSSEKDLNDSINITPKKSHEVIELGYLTSEVMKLKKTEKNENKIKPITQSIFEFAGVLFLFGFLIRQSILKNNGEEISFGTGKRSGLARIAFSIVETIGVPATLIIGLIFIGLITYRTYLRFKNPLKEIILKK